MKLTRTDVVVLVVVLGICLVVFVAAFLSMDRRRHHLSTRRRMACMNNLKQAAIAIESYCGDYNGYFPCYPAYGKDPQPLKGEHWDMGLYVDASTGQSVRTGNREYWAGPSRYRCIFYGSKMKDTAGREWGAFAHDRLNVGPIGLGTVLAGGYLADAAVLYCPVAKKVPKIEGMGALTELKELTRIGGRDGRALMYGDYSWAESYSEGQSDRGVLSTYNYRNVPLAIDPSRKLDGTDFAVPDTQPVVKTQAGCPMFKTQRDLGGRALVSDSFDRPSSPFWKEGFGKYVHKEGYNVLYGDHHAMWYGDPGRHLINLPTPPGFEIDAAQGSDVSFVPVAPLQNQAFYSWHMFDMAGGIDAK